MSKAGGLTSIFVVVRQDGLNSSTISKRYLDLTGKIRELNRLAKKQDAKERLKKRRGKLLAAKMQFAGL